MSKETSFEDFLKSVQEEEKVSIKLSNISFNYRLKSSGSSNSELWATVNGHWYALYDGKLRTNAPVDNEELKSLLEKELDKHLPDPLIENLQYLNFFCEHDGTAGMLITGDYNFKQVQEGDKQGWTLVYNRDKKIIAYMNWQACGCLVETIDDEFYDFLRRITKKGGVYAGLDNPVKTPDGREFRSRVEKILKLEKKWLKHNPSDKMHLLFQSDKEFDDMVTALRDHK